MAMRLECNRRSCWRRTPDGKDGWWYLEGCGVADWLSRG